MKWPYVVLALVAATLASAVGDDAPSLVEIPPAEPPLVAPTPDTGSALTDLKREQNDYHDRLVDMKEIADQLAGRLNVQPPKSPQKD